MLLPYGTYPDSCSHPPIKLPPYLLLRLTMFGSGKPTFSQYLPVSYMTCVAPGLEASHNLLSSDSGMPFEHFTNAES